MATRTFSNKRFLWAGVITGVILMLLFILHGAASAATLSLTSKDPSVFSGQPVTFKGEVALQQGETVHSVTFSVNGPQSFSVALPIPADDGKFPISLQPAGVQAPVTGTVTRKSMDDSTGYGYGPDHNNGRLVYELSWTPSANGDYVAHLQATSSSSPVGEVTRPFTVGSLSDFSGKIDFTGIVQSLPNGLLTGMWKVQGISVNVTADTKVHGTPAQGSLVKVQGALASDGTVTAKQVHVKNDEAAPKPKDQGKDEKKDKDDHGKTQGQNQASSQGNDNGNSQGDQGNNQGNGKASNQGNGTGASNGNGNSQDNPGKGKGHEKAKGQNKPAKDD